MTTPTTTLLVARHGNTFESGESPRRVGARTDLPLTQKGEAQATAIGQWIAANNYAPTALFTSALQRTRKTGALALQAANITAPATVLDFLNEIDYGPDENQTEDAVIARLGHDTMTEWETKGIMPPAWSPRPETIIAGWDQFAQTITRDYAGQCVLAVTSNGIARFAQNLCPQPADLAAQYGLKLATGAVAVFTHNGHTWAMNGWNIRP